MSAFENRQKIFYLVLLGVFFLHVGFMWVQVRDRYQNVSWTPPRPIKLKLMQEVLEAAKTSNRKQIVQSEDSADKSKPLTPSYLSDKDRNFDRQTVARKTATFTESALGNAQVTQKAQSQKKSSSKTDVLKNLKLSDIGMAAEAPTLKEVSRSPASASIEGTKNGKKLDQGISATNDYVEEVALGDFTHLNTVEYKFYGFFHRIRQKLEQFWGKSIQEKADTLFRSGRRLPASENLITSLQITLNEKGEIVAVKILGTSGVKELDDAAIESFNQAGPFPNPPKDLLVNGKAVIEWGFVVKS
jgi:TonB family protein